MNHEQVIREALAVLQSGQALDVVAAIGILRTALKNPLALNV